MVNYPPSLGQAGSPYNPPPSRPPSLGQAGSPYNPPGYVPWTQSPQPSQPANGGQGVSAPGGSFNLPPLGVGPNGTVSHIPPGGFPHQPPQGFPPLPPRTPGQLWQNIQQHWPPAGGWNGGFLQQHQPHPGAYWLAQHPGISHYLQGMGGQFNGQPVASGPNVFHPINQMPTTNGFAQNPTPRPGMMY